MRGHGQSAYPKETTDYSEALTVADIAASSTPAARGMLAQRDDTVIRSLETIRVTTLVLVGANDTNFLAATDYIAAKISGSVKVVIPVAGHAANLHPSAFNRAMDTFLAGLAR